ETERAVSTRLGGLSIDARALAAASGIYRAAGAVRHHFERTVLAPHGLTWTGWVVLWVVWASEGIESRVAAAEAGISKGTLSGVATTLEAHALLRRRAHPSDARRVLMSLTPSGRRVMEKILPAFNEQATKVMGALTEGEARVLNRALHKIVTSLKGS